MKHKTGNRRGFSLVEVNLAILLVALGMLALFGIFPAALREGDRALTDTHTALFADYVLSGIQGNAMSVTNWNKWVVLNTARAALLSNIVDDDSPGNPIYNTGLNSFSDVIVFSGNDIHYMLNIDVADSTLECPLYAVKLWVWSGTYVPPDVAKFKAGAMYYSTVICFRGAMP